MKTYKVVPNTIEGERLRAKLAAFFEANGIPVADIPIAGNDIRVRILSITTDVLVRDDDGRFMVDMGTCEHVRDRLTFPRRAWRLAPAHLVRSLWWRIR